MAVREPVALIRSPRAGRAGEHDPAALLAAFGLTVAQDVEVRVLDGAQGIGREWRERGFGAVVAAGGDGAIGCAAEPALESDLPLGILPAGTANDVARSLGLPLRLEAAAAALAGGEPVDIDAGQALALASGASIASIAEAERMAATCGDAGRIFLHLAAVGAKVEFARLATDPNIRKRWGRLTYPLSFLLSLYRSQAFPVTLRLAERDATGAERVVRCRALQVLVANTPVLGGALNLRLPDVIEDDRLLNVLVVEAPEWRRLGAVLLRPQWRAVRGMSADGSTAAPREHEQDGGDDGEGCGPALLPRVRRYATRAVVMETAEPLDVTLDGEIRMRTPLLVRVAERPVPVLLPIGSRHGRARHRSARPRVIGASSEAEPQNERA